MMEYDNLHVINFKLFEDPCSKDIYTIEFIDRMARLFGEDSDKLLIEIMDAIDKCDVKIYKDKLHALKGIAGNMFAEKLAAICKLAQELPDDDKFYDHAKRYIEDLKLCQQNTKSELTNYIARSSKE